MINLRPPFLKTGSRIHILSTARKVEMVFIEKAKFLLQSRGYRVSLGRTLELENNQFAGKLSDRVADLQAAMDDPEVDAIWCARGGYGTVLLIDQLDFSAFQRCPKWIIGYSDITGLLCHLYTLGYPSIHGPMPVNIKSGKEEDLEHLFEFLAGNNLNYKMPEHPITITGDCTGPIIGGNLSVMYSILGSRSAPNTNGCILFLEDLDEYLYHIDRMMLNIKRNGVLDNVSGVIVGGMTDMNDNAVPFGKNAEEILADYLHPLGVPVYFGFNAGHVSPNLPLPFGVDAAVKNGVLSIG